jgi:multidrug efflux pump
MVGWMKRVGFVRFSVGPRAMPLAVMARIREEMAPLQVSHLGQFPASTVSFNLAPGASLGEAVNAIKQAQADRSTPTTRPIRRRNTSR